MPAKIRETTKRIILGCTYSKPSESSLSLEGLQRDYAAQGYIDCPYHIIIKRNGSIQQGRYQKRWSGISSRPEVNQESLAVLLIGGGWRELDATFIDNYTIEQYETLERLHLEYPDAIFEGLGDVEGNPALGPFFETEELKFLEETNID